jgi:hypothetical protein
MSHVVVIELQVKDLQALGEAAKQLGGELVIGQMTFKWYGRWMNDYHGQDAAYRKMNPEKFGKCDHAVKHPKCKYEIGVVRQEDGSFTVLADEWGEGGLPAVFGKGMHKLKQRYGACVAAKTMRRQGFSVKEVDDEETGYLRLVCSRN